MRLTIQTSLLSKAGRQGLIAVQKQVTKKGKTFTQTFYVKPDTLPKAQNGPTAVVVLEQRPKKIQLLRGSETYEFESNRPEGGFYINMRKYGEPVAVRVPEKYIVKTLEHRGHTFVVHRRLRSAETPEWDADFAVTELVSGLRAGSGETPEDAEMMALAQMTEEKLPQERLNEVIRKAGKVEDVADVTMDTEDWPTKEPKKFLSAEEITILATGLWEDILDGEDGGFAVEQVEEWLRDTEKVKTAKDAELAKNDFGNQWTLEQAIVEEITYDEALERETAIGEIQVLAMHSDMFGGEEMDWDTVADWARENEDNLVDGFDASIWGVNYKSGDEAWTVNDIVAYAITNNVSLKQAEETAEIAVKEEEEEMEAEEMADISIDSDGKNWDGHELQTLGTWVNGSVRGPRDSCKALDDCRRQRSEEECEADYPIVRIVEEHLSPYVGTPLYRGTGNTHHAWLESKPGDIIPYGMSSFSRSEIKARGFGGEVLLIIEDTKEVMGVDVYQLIRDGKEAGFERALSETGVDSYEDEQEFLIRAPALEIIRREENRVYLKPVEMNLLEMMKSIFADRIKAMERTFDYPLHREPEDAWN